MKDFTIKTQNKSQIIDITSLVEGFIRENGFEEGVLFVHANHTTVALSIADLDPGTDLDILDALREMVPKLSYRHPHNPSHVGDHILSSILKPQVFVLVKDGKPVLGTWQRIIFIEFDGPRERNLIFHFLKS